MTVMQNRLAAATMVLALATCSSAPETSKGREESRPEAVAGQQPDHPPIAAWDHLAEGASWTATLMESLNSRGDRLLAAAPQDATAFCPGFAALDREGRRAFYVGLISKMAEFESGFDPATTFQEAFNDAQGRPVISRGLLQLSIESARAYRGCVPESAEELHDPRTNLTCTVAILQRWMSQDGFIGVEVDGGWRGGARYWSVLRTTSPRREQIENFTRALPICATG